MMKFKCPVCKTILQLGNHQSYSDKITCDNCDSSFSKSKIKELFKQFQNSKSHQTNTDQPVTKSAKAPRPKKSKTATADNSDNVGTKNEIKIATSIDTHTATLTKQVKQKSKRNNYLLLGLAILSIALVAVLTVVLQWPNEQSPSENASHNPTAATEDANENAATDNATELGDSKNEITPDNNPKRLSEPDESEDLPATPRIPFSKLDNVDHQASAPNNRIVPKKTLDNCWLAAKPYLVELHAETATGPKFSTGIIVDSRGWVLTSFRAAEGATTIHVRKARQSASDNSLQTQDQVRGIVASMPKLDLALLSINRQLVNTFEELPFATVDSLVPSQHVTMCIPPTAAFPFRAVETRIEKRTKSSDLDSNLANLVSRMELDPNVRWIIHKNESPLCVGAPLMDDEGQVVGFNLGPIAGTNESFALPATDLAEILSSSNEQVKPLQSFNSIVTNDNNTSAPTHSLQVVDPNSTFRELSEKLNRIGSDCDLFNWTPTSQKQDDLLRQFVQVHVAVFDRLDAADSTNNDAQTLSEQLKSWQEKLAIGLGVYSNVNRAQQEKFNRKFAKSADKTNDTFIGFVYVRYSAMESPKVAIDKNSKPSDTVVFEFKGNEQRIITNLKREWPPLPPDSPWLVIGESVEGQVRLVGRGRKKELLDMSKIQTVIQSN